MRNDKIKVIKVKVNHNGRASLVVIKKYNGGGYGEKMEIDGKKSAIVEGGGYGSHRTIKAKGVSVARGGGYGKYMAIKNVRKHK